MAIYTIVIAGVWQATGFCMAMFLAGLRGIDGRDPQGGADRRRVHLRDLSADRHPLLRPVFLSAFIVLAHMTIKSY
jgi:glucose/mannose transport system permease protein